MTDTTVRSILLAAVVAVAAVFAVAAPAVAGEYTVFSCASPTGATPLTNWIATGPVSTARYWEGDRCGKAVSYPANPAKTAALTNSFGQSAYAVSYSPTVPASANTSWTFTTAGTDSYITTADVLWSGGGGYFGSRGSGTRGVNVDLLSHTQSGAGQYGIGYGDPPTAPLPPCPGCSLARFETGSWGVGLVAWEGSCLPVETCGWLGSPKLDRLPPGQHRGLRISAYCTVTANTTAEGAQCMAAWLVKQVKISLVDPAAPTGSVDSPMFLTGRAAGAVPVSVTATDGGSGLTSVELVVDGAGRGRTGFADQPGTCSDADPSDGNPYQYTVVRPCRAQGAVTTALDTSDLSDGPHGVRVVVRDAAGNEQIVKEATVMVANGLAGPGAPSLSENPLSGLPGHVHNGRGQASTGRITAGFRAGSGRRATRLTSTGTVPFGATKPLRGRLVDDRGKGITDATLVVITVWADGRRKTRHVKTNSTGRFSSPVGWGTARSVFVRWYPWSDLAEAITSKPTKVSGAARVSLQANRPRNGQALTLRGRVRHAPRGMRVTIQVLDGRTWHTFLSPRVGNAGRFTAQRMLRRSAGRSYCVRARVLANASPAFAFAAGASKPVCFRVRG